MQRLNQYMLRQLVGPFAFFSVALTGVIWLSQSLRFVDWIFNKGLSMGFFFYLTLLILPGVLAIVLSNVVFSVTHLHLGWICALSSFIPGLFWGWMYYRQRSLVGVSISHVLIGVWLMDVLDLTSMLQ